MIEGILRSVRPTRKSFLIDKHFINPKVKFKANSEYKNYDQTPRLNKRRQKATD